MITIEYDGLDSYDDFQITCTSADRPTLPVKRKREIAIPGKQGSYDFGGDTYSNRVISVAIQYVGASFNDLRLRARDIAAWLSKMSYRKLIFSDEPDKYYLAKIYSAVGLEYLLKVGRATIQFECQPHALYVVTSAEDVDLDDDVPLDSDIILDSGNDYTISL